MAKNRCSNESGCVESFSRSKDSQNLVRFCWSESVDLEHGPYFAPGTGLKQEWIEDLSNGGYGSCRLPSPLYLDRDPMQFSFLVYERPFRQPLQTRYGLWRIRRGILVRLQDVEGRTGYGEVAPLPWFGSETLAEALSWCQECSAPNHLLSIPDTLPATQFAVSCAQADLYDLDPRLDPAATIPLCGLLGSPAQARSNLENLDPFPVYKLKIGLGDPQQEQGQIKEILQLLPPDVRIRLDANGGLTLAQAQMWGSQAEWGKRVEFLEQPLDPGNFESMLTLSQSSRIPIALDESVAGLAQLEACWRKRWRSPVVIKPAISGSLALWSTSRALGSLDCIVSGTFETLIGTYHAARLAHEYGLNRWAAGYGLERFLPDDGANPMDPFRGGLGKGRAQMDQVWRVLGGRLAN